MTWSTSASSISKERWCDVIDPGEPDTDESHLSKNRTHDGTRAKGFDRFLVFPPDPVEVPLPFELLLVRVPMPWKLLDRGKVIHCMI